MSRTSRLWKGVGPLTLGGLLLSGGALALAADNATPLADQLVQLGRQAAAQGRVEDSRSFYQNALKLDPSNAVAKSALDQFSKVRRVAYQVPGQTAPDPTLDNPPATGVPEPTALERQSQLADVQRQAFVTEVRQRMQQARDLSYARHPDAALNALRDALAIVQSADNVPEDSRRRLENEVRNAIVATERLEERTTLEQAEQYRIAASQAARTSAVDRLVRDQETTGTLMAQFDSLIAEGEFRVLSSGGLGDIDTTRQPFVDARFKAQAARAQNPYDLAPWAGMFVADTIGFYSQSIQYDRLKEYRAMLTWADVDRSSVPFPDTRAIEYPERSAWQALSERRINRYSDSDYLFDRDDKTKAILKKLADPISMNFPNDTPLEDVIKYIKTATQDERAGLPSGIPIYPEPIGMEEVDANLATSMIKLELEGIPLKTTLRLALAQIKLTYTVKDGLLTITGVKADDQPTELRVYYAADLAMIPLSLMGMGGGGGGGGMGGGMGGMGGGMGGMGGGMGGMGGGGMGGGMGGMGGMMSMPPQVPSPFEEKKSN